MITVAAPGFLVAGGLLAAIPVVLHLLSRRPPSRAALPTARFLTEDSRTRLRLRRMPSDVPLLALRVLFALALGAAFAGLRWVPQRDGLRQVILVDAGADDRVPWEAISRAVGEVVGELDSDADAPGPDALGEEAAATPLVLAYGLDDGPVIVAPEAVGALSRGSGPATLEDGLRALRREASRSRFARAEVTWVGGGSWRAWSPGVGLLRPALWPGRVRLRPVTAVSRGALDPGAPASDGAAPPAGTAALPSSAPPPPLARVVVSGSGDAVRRALRALGGRFPEAGPVADVPVASPDGPDSSPAIPDGDSDAAAEPPNWIVAQVTGDLGLESWLPRVRAGATLLAFGEPPVGRPELPWSAGASPTAAAPGPDDPPTASPREPALVLLPGDRAVGDPVPRTPGGPTPGARTLLTFDDGTPAAAAREFGEGCVAFAAVDLTARPLTTSPAYPELIRALLPGCRGEEFGDGPLDRGALQALERPDLPETVEVAAVLTPEGRPWTRWLLVAALVLLALEVALTRSGASRVPASGVGEALR